MKIKILIPTLMIGICSISIFSQTKKAKTVKPKVRANVTVKTGIGKDPKKVDETENGLWNKFSSPENKFDIVFPSKNENLFVDNPIDDIFLYEAKTNKAAYAVIVKPFEFIVLPQEREILYDDLIENIFLKGKTKPISSKNTTASNFAGREVVFEMDENRVFGQIYVIENRIYIVSVYLKKSDYNESFDVWINKFFDSFELKIKNANES